LNDSDAFKFIPEDLMKDVRVELCIE